MRDINLKKNRSTVLLSVFFILMACWLSAGLRPLTEVYIHAARHFAEHIHSGMKDTLAEIETKVPDTVPGGKTSVRFRKAKEFVSEYHRREIAPYRESRIHMRHSILIGLGLSTILLYLIAAVGVIACFPWRKQAAWGVLMSHFLYLAAFVYELLVPALILKEWRGILDAMGASLVPPSDSSILNTVFNSSNLFAFMVYGAVVAATVFYLRTPAEKGCHKKESEGSE